MLSRRRNANTWPIFSLSLAGLIGVCAGGVGAAPVLPRGGAVQAGLASIGVASGNSLTVNQSSQRAIINWSSFSIGAGGTVQFDNGSGVTLNRVTGGSVSSIQGLLSATGSVYVLNPAGVIIGKDGLVNVGGGFVASTLGLANASFMAGGPLTFTGSSDASVTNQGRINALGGDVSLIGATVRNDGEIDAPAGTAALGAGQSVVLLDAQSDGKLNVLIGGAQTSVTNTGLIAAASAELRANGGNIYALAVNTGSRIEATGISAHDGNVSLIAEGGSVTARGEITATKADGSGGQVETSGNTVNFTGLRVKARDWLIDPITLTVDAAAASTIDTNLATTSVTLQTTATSAGGPGNQTSGAGDIIIASPITWSSANTFTLDAYHSIAVNADITVAGAGQVVFKTNDGGTGGDYSFAKGDSLSFTGAEGDGQGLTINGAPYTLVYTQADLLNINNNLAGDYALAAPLDFQNGSPPTPEAFSAAPVASLVSTPFTGTFTGLGNTISNFTIAKAIPVLQVNAVDNATYASLGLFGTVGPGGVVRDVGVLNSDVTGTNGMTAGLLVGSLQAGAEVLNSYSSGEVDVGDGVSTSQGFAYAIAGGLVGGGSGQIVNSGSSASVYAGDAFAGGLMGAISAGGAISGSNASGFVSVSGMSSDPAALSAGAIPEGGGLVGLIYGYKPDGVTVDSVTVTNSYATGGVNGGGGSFLGGFVGDLTQGQITNSYATGYINQSAGGQNGEDSLAGGFAGYLAAGAVVSQSWSGGGVNTQGSSGAQIPGQPAGVDYYTFAGGFVGDMDPIAKLPAPTASQDYALGYVSSGGSS